MSLMAAPMARPLLVIHVKKQVSYFYHIYDHKFDHFSTNLPDELFVDISVTFLNI